MLPQIQSLITWLFVRFPHPTIHFDKSNFLHIWKVNELHKAHRQNSLMRNCLCNNTFPSMCKSKDIPSVVIYAQFNWIKSRINRNYTEKNPNRCTTEPQVQTLQYWLSTYYSLCKLSMTSWKNHKSMLKFYLKLLNLHYLLQKATFKIQIITF